MVYMALTWRGRRQVLYYGVGGIAALVLLFVLWQAFLARQPSCYDNIYNQNEIGVDCGGVCARLCPAQVRSPVVLWDRPFLTTPGTYSAIAYVENRNVGSGAQDVEYSFKLYDERGILVAERLGTIDIPPVGLVPIVETNITVGNRTVASSDFAFGNKEIVWERNIEVPPELRLSNQQLEPGGTRLTANLVNDGIQEVRNVSVVAVLFDAQGVARAASKTTLARLPRQSQESLVFTWPQGVAGAVRAELTILPQL